jgi:hypothetical protein
VALPNTFSPFCILKAEEACCDRHQLPGQIVLRAILYLICDSSFPSPERSTFSFHSDQSKTNWHYSTSVLHSNTWKLSGQYAQPNLVGPPPQGIATLHLPSSPLSAIRVRWSLQRACNSTTLLCDRPSCQITCHCTCVHTVLLNPDKNRKRSVIGAALTVLLQQPSHQLTTAHTTFWESQGKDHGSSPPPSIGTQMQKRASPLLDSRIAFFSFLCSRWNLPLKDKRYIQT